MALLDSLGITLCIPLLNIAKPETNNQSNYFEIIKKQQNKNIDFCLIQRGQSLLKNLILN